MGEKNTTILCSKNGGKLGKLRKHIKGIGSTTNLIDCRTVSLCSAAFTLIFSNLMSLFSRSIWAL